MSRISQKTVRAEFEKLRDARIIEFQKFTIERVESKVPGYSLGLWHVRVLDAGKLLFAVRANVAMRFVHGAVNKP